LQEVEHVVNKVETGAHVVPSLSLEQAPSVKKALSTEEILSTKEASKAHNHKQALCNDAEISINMSC
jgi:hypothetical protein